MRNRVVIHDLFKAGIFVKGVVALVELIFGVLLFFVTSDFLLKGIHYLFGHELMQDPADVFVNFLLGFFSSFSGNVKLFFAMYLLIHGVIKLGLIAALWKEKLWAYPTSMVVFLLFMVYQVYRYFQTYSFFLIVLTAIDIFVIVLIYLEYSGFKNRVDKKL